MNAVYQLCWISVVGLLAAASASARAEAVPWQLDYAGGFRLPHTRSAYDSKFTYAGRSITVGQGGDTLWVQGHEHHQMIAEVQIPEELVKSQKVEDMPIAEMVTPFLDVTRGRIEAQLGGAVVDPRTGVFWWTQEQFYDVSSKVYPTIGYTAPNLKDARGPWMCDVGNKLTERYLTLAPREFAEQHLGGRFLICGQAGVAGTAGSSQGPCAVAVETPQRDGEVLSTVKLLFYPQEKAFREARGSWGRADKVWSTAWISVGGEHWLVFSAVVGTGVTWYGKPDEPPAGGTVDRWQRGKGYHSPPYEERLYVYSVDDLVRVARGEMPSWSPRPMKVFDLRPALLRPGNAIVALAYDKRVRRLYMCENNGDPTQTRFGNVPVVHVYDVVRK